MKRSKSLILGLIIGVFVLWFIFDLGHLLTLANAKAEQTHLQRLIHQSPWLASAAFFGLYLLVTALSLPGAVIMSLLGAALFGFWWSLVLVSFASTLGACCAFLFSRFILRDWVEKKFGHRLHTINQGLEKDGIFYLLTLRLIPIFPFFLINLLMGLTRIRLRSFYWVSQLGMLAGTAIYLNAGTQLASITSLRGIISPEIILSLGVLGIFPLIAKKLMEMQRTRKKYSRWLKPKQFDRDMVIIGAGAGGLVSSYIAAAVKAKVTLIEKHNMGGDCLNTGCVPSKALIHTARTYSMLQKTQHLGIHHAHATIDFVGVMEHIQSVIKTIAPHDSVKRYESLGVECLSGHAQLLSPWEVQVNDQRLTTRNIVIATGARPSIPNIPGLDAIPYFTSDTIWDLRIQPKHLLVLGGGPIGSELAQSFQRLGSKVTLIQRNLQLLSKEDTAAVRYLEEQLTAEGLEIKCGHHVTKFTLLPSNTDTPTSYQCTLMDNKGKESHLTFDTVLIALGRTANTTGYGLDTLGIPITERGTIATNAYLQAHYPNVFAVGDVAGPYQLTHAAAHQAWYAAVNGLFGQFKRFKVDYSVLPHVTYTSPEIARVGLNEKEAKLQNLPYELIEYLLSDLDRAITDDATHGVVRVLTKPNKGTILGVTIVGEQAGEMLAEFTLAMKHGLGLNKILSTIHPYPTLSEANKYAAGVWKKKHAPEHILKILSRYHYWRRTGSLASSHKDSE